MKRIQRYLARVWHVIRNRPIIYGVKFCRGPGVINLAAPLEKALVEDCEFSGNDESAMRIAT